MIAVRATQLESLSVSVTVVFGFSWSPLVFESGLGLVAKKVCSQGRL